MKITAKQITSTAALLALCIISQFFKSSSTFITGPIINACLILAVLSSGLAAGMILAIITPITSFMITGSPIMSAIPAIIPFIMLGNAILACFTYLLYKKIKHKAGLYLGMLTGVIVKAIFMGITISLVLIPNLLPAASKMAAQIQTFQYTFSVFQLITGVIGAIYASIIWIPLKKGLASNWE